MSEWNRERARDLYSIRHWSDGYFDIDTRGQLCALPRGGDGAAVALAEVVAQAASAGLKLPLMVRFTDILDHRARALCAAFERAMADKDYQAAYHAVYPIKVNQQKSVVEHIVAANDTVGLEAGSKPELMAVLAQSRPGGVVICNGYKDAAYVRLALIGQQLGLRVFLVVEKLNELPMILEAARELDIRPVLGVRLRLASLGKGNWQNTGGEKAKFGLSAGQLLQAVALLRETGYSDCLQLLHFHMGSQISNLRDIQRGILEAARYYAELSRAGLKVGYLDVGGGLGVDYEGTRSRAFCSVNYKLDEYANTIVGTIGQVCREAGVAVPGLITESGRAMSAHHAMLVTNVTAVEPVPDNGPVPAPADDAPAIIHDLWRTFRALDQRPALELYQEARQLLEDGRQEYLQGRLRLEQRAALEQLYRELCHSVLGRLREANRSHREALDELKDQLADKYFCNFSVFQSVPDVWAIEQIFPIVPLSRLDEPPARRAVIEDLTCDSDGRIDRFVDFEGIETTLPVHDIRAGETYLLGLFLVGAYQETLGDIHNLFGDTDTVDVQLRDGDFVLANARQGDDAARVLGMVGYEAAHLRARLEDKIQSAELDPGQQEDIKTILRDALKASTYLDVR